MGYILGLDVGIASAGWSILKVNENLEPYKIERLGVRVFDKAEQPKTGAALALPRREARGARRRLRRRKHRIERIKKLIFDNEILTKERLESLYEGEQLIDIYDIRYQALEQKLSNEAFARLLIHLAKKRGFKSNRKKEKDKEDGKLLEAVEANRLRMETMGYRTVGEMLVRDPLFSEHKRNTTEDYLCTVSRMMMEEEIIFIFAQQRAYENVYATEELETNYLNIYLSQRSFDEGPGGKSPYRNPLEKMVGNCTFEPTEKRCPKASATFEYFVLLNQMNNLRIQMPGREVRGLGDEERQKVVNLAFRKSPVTYTDLRKALKLPENISFKGIYIGNKTTKEVEDKKNFVKMEGYHQLRKALDKVEKNLIAKLAIEEVDTIAYALTLYKTDEKIQAYLQQGGINQAVIESVSGISFSKFGHLSLKAIRKIIPYLEEGAVYNEACEKAGYAFNQVELPETKKAFIDSITNPVVRRGVSQAVKVVEHITRTYGPPARIHIELARDMSRDFSERKKIEKNQEENRARNEKLMKEIQEVYGYKANGQMLLKYRLWKEQDGRCMYSGNYIEPARLFSDPMYTDIDHILPYSKTFDDSYGNKVLVVSGENRQKGNRTPYEYLCHDEEQLRLYEERVRVYVRNIGKQRRLLKQHITEEDQENFKERNLNDTRYMTKLLSQYFKQKIVFDESYLVKKRVIDVNGSMTAYCRKRWGLNKVREDGDLHHALDAVVIACVTDGIIQKVTKYHQGRENECSTKDGFPEPWTQFRNEVEARLQEDPMVMIRNCKLTTYASDEQVKPVFVSRMPRRKHKGAIHEATLRSGKKQHEGYTISRIPLTKLKLDKEGEIEGYYNKEANVQLYEVLRERLMQYGGKGEGAFKEPIYKPQKQSATPIPIKKVKIMEKATIVVPLNDGNTVAKNDSMVRVDVFTNSKKQYFLVPIYMKDMLKDTLPNKAITLGKQYKDWTEMDADYTFLFSIYPNDLLYIKAKKGIKLSKKDKSTKEEKEGYFYYKSTDIATGSIKVITQDGAYEARGVGVKTLLAFQKYQVDVLGDKAQVKGEKREK